MVIRGARVKSAGMRKKKLPQIVAYLIVLNKRKGGGRLPQGKNIDHEGHNRRWETEGGDQGYIIEGNGKTC